MPRLLGVDIPADKPLWISMTYIFGIGKVTSKQVCSALGLDPVRRAHTLTADELAKLSTFIEKTYAVEGNLRRQRTQAVNRLRDIKCYRGSRHRAGLPARGQRTRTNARTRKGPRKTIAGKKMAVK